MQSIKKYRRQKYENYYRSTALKVCYFEIHWEFAVMLKKDE